MSGSIALTPGSVSSYVTDERYVTSGIRLVDLCRRRVGNDAETGTVPLSGRMCTSVGL